MVPLIGNIFKAAEVRTSDTGKFIAFTLVQREGYKTKEGKRRYRKTYFNCTMWNAVKLAPYLTSDIPVIVTGSITAKSYTTADKKVKASIHVLVKNLEFIPYPKSEGSNDEALEETFDDAVEAE